MKGTAQTISLLDAAKATGKNKSTILRRIKHKDVNNRILADQSKNGEWQVNLNSLSQHYQFTNDGLVFLETKNAPDDTPSNLILSRTSDSFESVFL